MHFASPAILLLLLSLAALSECQSAFSAGAQQKIVDIHNTLRSKIAKGTYVAGTTKKASATNMRKMSWDASIATLAQTYADTCPRGHSKDRKNLGENLHYYWTTLEITELDSHGGSASVSWESEFQKFGWPSNTFTHSNMNIGHATQMAWADTNLIGCGVKSCGPDEKKKKKKQVLMVTPNGTPAETCSASSDPVFNRLVVVCQYGPPGNWLNKNIYESGTTCSACPTGTACETATGLCA